MLFVFTGTWRENLSDEDVKAALARRASWQYPDGMRPVGEWWRPGASDPAIISVFEADSYAPILELSLTWESVLNIQCTPAVSAQEGILMGAEVLQKLAN
jgi:hypothetical protein